MKKATLRDIATSLTALIFIVIGMSGVMIYFHFYDMQVRELHEIIGLVFVSVTLFHIFVNWKSMKKYFSKKIFIITLVATTIVSSGFVINSLNQGQNPKLLVIQSVLTAPIKNSLKVLNIEYEVAMKKLEAQNIKIENNSSIQTIAQANKISPFKVVLIITNK